MIAVRRKPMAPNKHKHIFRFTFYISIKAVLKTKLFDGEATRTTTCMERPPPGSQLRDPVFQN